MYGTNFGMMAHAGKPVTSKNFIGREKELALIMEYLKLGQSIVLVAPRRFGKTSLVLEVLQRIQKQGLYTAFVDIFTNPGMDMLSANITGEVLKNHKLNLQFHKAKTSALELIKNVKLKAVLNDFEFIAGFADKDRNDWELIAESIDFVDAFSKRHNRKMVCAYDEFGDITKFDKNDELVKLFRSKIQQHKNSTYIFSGSYESVMQAMFVTRVSPFYRMARIVHLSYLEKDALVRHLQHRFREEGINCGKDFPRQIAAITHCHPYYAQLAFQQTILYKALYKKIPSSNELLQQIIAVEKDYLEKVWEDVYTRRDHVLTLKALAHGSENIYGRLKTTKINVARALKNLEGMGLVFRKENGQPFISDPIFNQWIIQTTT